jgi:excisionase family DNA binding protein
MTTEDNYPVKQTDQSDKTTVTQPRGTKARPESHATAFKAKLLTMEEVAAYLGLKISTLYEWCALEKIEYIKVGRYTRFKPEQLDRWLTAHTVKARTHWD